MKNPHLEVARDLTWQALQHLRQAMSEAGAMDQGEKEMANAAADELDSGHNTLRMLVMSVETPPRQLRNPPIKETQPLS